MNKIFGKYVILAYHFCEISVFRIHLMVSKVVVLTSFLIPKYSMILHDSGDFLS